MEGVLSPDQAAALFREDKEAARYFLCDRLAETMREPGVKDTTTLDCPAGRFLELYWKLFGPSECIGILPISEVTIVDYFFKAKLHHALDEFSEDDLVNLATRYRDKPMHAEVIKARARKLVPLANLLLSNPAELNRDIAAVKNRVSEYCFTTELNEVLDKVEAGLAADGDQFDQAALLKHLRTFWEKLHEQVALRLHAVKPETVDGTDLTKSGQVLDFLVRKGVLKEKMRDYGRALYGVLSNEGVHAFKSEKEYVRLFRNTVAEYALVLFFELERRLQH
jgi:hypothetical protein